jgi:MFS family permease
MAMPFFAVFMLVHLKLPFWHTTGLLAIGSVAGLVGNRFWARLSTRFGVKPVVLLASIGDSLFPLCWVLIEPEWSWVLPVVFMFGLFSSPVAIGANNMLLKIVPDERASSYIAVFNSIVGPLTAVAAILGGAISQSLIDWSWSVGPIELGGLKIVFLLSFLGRLASLSLLRRVEEPHAKSLADIAVLLVRARRLAARRREAASREERPLSEWIAAGMTPVVQTTD